MHLYDSDTEILKILAKQVLESESTKRAISDVEEAPKRRVPATYSERPEIRNL